MDEMSDLLLTMPSNCSMSAIPPDGTLPNECLYGYNMATGSPPVVVATDELDLMKFAASPIPMLLAGDPWRNLCEQIFFYGLPMIIVSGFIFSFSAVLALSRQLDSSTEVYLFTLALSNWFLLGAAAVLHIENYTGRLNIIQRIQIYCRALHEWLWYVSCWMVIVMTIECLVTVCQKRLTSLCSKSQALVLTVLVYATCLISVLPEFWAYEVKALTDTNSNSTVYRLHKSLTMNTMEYTVMYYWYIQSITFLIPYPLLLLTAGVILRNGGTRCRVITTTIPAANAQINARGTGIVITHSAPSPRLGGKAGNGLLSGYDFHSHKSNGDYKHLYDPRGPSFKPQANGNNLLVTIRQPESEVQLNRSIIATSICYSVLTLPHVATQFLLRNFAPLLKDDIDTSKSTSELFAPIALMQGSQLVFKLFFYSQFGILFLLLVCHMERFRQSLARVCCSCCIDEDAMDDNNQDVAAIEPIARLDLTENGNAHNHITKDPEDLEANGVHINASWMNGNGSLKSAHYSNGNGHHHHHHHHNHLYENTMHLANGNGNGTMNGSLKQTKPLKPIIKNSRTPQIKNTSPPEKLTAGYHQQEQEKNGLVVMQSTV